MSEEFVLVERKWMPIGEYGFLYYWDPFWEEPLTGCMEIHFTNLSAGYARQWTVNPEGARGGSYMTWLVQHAYEEVESVWLRTRQ